MLNILLRISDLKLPLQNPILIFSTILFIILFAPILLNKLKIPHLIGLIIAGALIGPNGFYLMERDSSFKLFGQVGLLYIMFLAGLEIDWAEFKKNSGRSLGFGIYTFLIPMGLGILAGYYLLGFTIQSSVLLASLFASHTLIAYPLVSKLGVAKNRAVNVTIGGTLITDTLALLVLAVVVGISTGEYSDIFWWRLGISILVFAVLVATGFPVLARWFFKRYEDSISQYIFVLALVFLAAFLAEVAGVEGIIGAFLAGLALNRLIPHTSALMNRIEFVGNALFIPFFLIGVGMLIDYRVFFKSTNSIIVAVVMTTIAISAKYVAALLAQKTFGYNADERRVIFGLISAQAAATLAAVLIGYNIITGTDADGNPIRLLNENVLNGSILMILVTCTVASFGAQKGAMGIALKEANEPKEAGQQEEDDTAEKILIAISEPDMAAELMDWSFAVKGKAANSHLYALHVLDSTNPLPTDEKKAEKVLELAANEAAATDNKVHLLKRYDFNIGNAIASVVAEQGITDIVLGLHRQKGFSDNFLGNLTHGILAKCNATVHIYKWAQPVGTIKRLVVVVPAHAEQEIGFPFWLVKLWNISKNTGSKLVIYAPEETISVIEKIAQKHPAPIEYHRFSNWEDFLIISRDVKPNDCLFIIMSRKNFISYSPTMAKIPHYLNVYFEEVSFVLVYPLQTTNGYHEASDLKNPSVLMPLKENLVVLDDLGKTITKLFKRR
ncbi:MAG TPA: cation:proton antiporter [Phnomibacter sp.]|nr:cation:proton antiporter [Phnomibacter sp.]